MSARERIMGRRRSLPAPTPPSTPSRRRRPVPKVVEAVPRGKVVKMQDGEEYVLKLLRGCPQELNKFRKGKYLHVSDLLGKCMRKIILSDKMKLSMPASGLGESMSVTFAVGTAIHDYVKGKFVRGQAGRMYGRWACLCGETITDPMLAENIPEEACPNCGDRPSKYVELEVHNDDLMVVGSPDIVLYLDELRAFYPVEIKSINPEDWKEIARPKPDHILQVLFYWYLMREAGYAVVDQISILYVNKGFVFKSPYKEFVVKPAEQLSRLDEYMDEARALKAAKAGGPTPARTMCSSLSCKEAKECHVAVACFQ